MQPIKMRTQHAPRRAYLFSFGEQKFIAKSFLDIFWILCSHKVPSDIPHMCSTSSQCDVLPSFLMDSNVSLN